WTIGRRLALMGVVLATPLSLLLIATITNLAATSRDAQTATMHYSARAIAAAVDARLSRHTALAQTLAAEPEVLDDDLSVFEAEARRVFADIHDARLLIADLDGQQLINLAAEPGQPLPKRDPMAIAVQQRSIEAGTAVVSDVVMGPVVRNWTAAIGLPILKEGIPFRQLAVNMDLKGLRQLLAAQGCPTVGSLPSSTGKAGLSRRRRATSTLWANSSPRAGAL